MLLTRNRTGEVLIPFASAPPLSSVRKAMRARSLNWDHEKIDLLNCQELKFNETEFAFGFAQF